jgi:ABC-type dipeptide/oligopeptide/nickel transport system permease subunit
MRHRLAMAGLGLILLIAALSILAPLIAPSDPFKVDLAFFRKPPNAAHLLGTDSAGRDVLSRMLYAGQVSLSVGLVAALMSTTIGLLLGSLAGTYAGWVDALIMRLTDVVLSFPALVVIITVVAVVGPSILTIIFGIGLFFWPTACRIVRGLALSLREQDFLIAARALGASDRHVIVRHLVPSVLSPLTVTATFAVAQAILLWLWLPPGVAIAVTVLAINFIGDGLRDALDPRQRL